MVVLKLFLRQGRSLGPLLPIRRLLHLFKHRKVVCCESIPYPFHLLIVTAEDGLEDMILCRFPALQKYQPGFHVILVSGALRLQF